MKQFLSLILASALGAIMTVAIFQWNQSEIEHPSNTSPKLSHQVAISSAAALPMDFVSASSKATEAVVHIRAQESKTLAQQRYNEQRQRQQQNRRNNPFGDFFNMEDFFGGGFGGDMFGQNFYQPKNGTGSGVVMSEDGYIITNNHVVGFADEIIVTLNNGKQYDAVKIGTDPSSDLAVLKIEADGLPKLKFADSDQVNIGEWVLAVGNPFDLTSTVTAGIVSAKGRDLDIIQEDKSIEEFIQTDAAVNPGNSGGALVNTNGDLVGINTAIATPTGVYAGYSFAIPSNLVNRIVNDIIENGDIERTSLGIAGNTLDKEIAKELSLKTDVGVYVQSVDRGSAAQFGGLLPNDVITKVNNTKIETFDDLIEVMKFTAVGDVLDITINRDGVKKTLPIRLKRKL